MTDFAVTRGDTVNLAVAVTRTLSGVSTVVNLTGAQLRFTVKQKTTDADANAVVRKGSPGTGFGGIVITSAAQGLATVTLADSDLPSKGYYRYDLQLKEADGTVSTIQSGRLTVLADVTTAS